MPARDRRDVLLSAGPWEKTLDLCQGENLRVFQREMRKEKWLRHYPKGHAWEGPKRVLSTGTRWVELPPAKGKV